MLPRYPLEPTSAEVAFEKYILPAEGETVADASRLGAFAAGTVLRLAVTCPRTLGATAVVLRLNRDGEAEHDTPFSFVETDPTSVTDRYELTLDTAALCAPAASGLFYYRLLFVRSADTLFTDSVNNVDFELVPRGGAAFRLLIHEPDFAPPAWFGEGVMYHVFVDRFCRGAGETYRREGERAPEINPDWERGIPQYPPYPGAPLSNHIHFGGNLWGVAEKLDYLESLGVKVIYLSPIFEAYSNHKYDTGDYRKVDGGFGGEPALDNLIEKATARGMRIILDGVFNHTGDDSRYFDRYGLWGTTGALQDPASPYRDWYCFRAYPDEYESWWGIPIMPKLNHAHEPCRRFFTGADGVCAHYIRKGISGWRLDVADELSDDFLDELRTSVKAAGAADAGETDAEGKATAPATVTVTDPVIIGEVWENAADKIAYGHRRRYFRGKQLDSVMNYPVRSGILAFINEGEADLLYHTLTELYGSYPRAVSDALMNLVGTHDTERILTVLGSTYEDFDRSNDILATATLSPARRATAVRRLKLASLLQFTVFGIPSVYYGDEVGMEGYHDPFCRRPFPWHEVEGDTPDAGRTDILNHYRALGELRRSPAFHGGDFRILDHGEHHIVYERRAVSGTNTDGSDRAACNRVVVAVHRGEGPADAVTIPIAILGDVKAVRLSCGEVAFDSKMLTLTGDSGCVLG